MIKCVVEENLWLKSFTVAQWKWICGIEQCNVYFAVDFTILNVYIVTHLCTSYGSGPYAVNSWYVLVSEKVLPTILLNDRLPPNTFNLRKLQLKWILGFKTIKFKWTNEGSKKKIVIQYERIARVQIKNSIRNAYGVLYFDNVETPYYYRHCHCRRGARYTMSLEILHMVQIKL